VKKGTTGFFLKQGAWPDARADYQFRWSPSLG